MSIHHSTYTPDTSDSLLYLRGPQHSAIILTGLTCYDEFPQKTAPKPDTPHVDHTSVPTSDKYSFIVPNNNTSKIIINLSLIIIIFIPPKHLHSSNIPLTFQTKLLQIPSNFSPSYLLLFFFSPTPFLQSIFLHLLVVKVSLLCNNHVLLSQFKFDLSVSVCFQFTTPIK